MVDLAYDESGTGTPVVLLHAFPLSKAMWARPGPGMAQFCRLITPDLRGFGASPAAEGEPSVDLMADDVADLLDRLGLERAVIGGVSMGGYVAMAFCRRYPDRVSGLILADTKATADAQQAREGREVTAHHLEQDGTPAILLEAVLPSLTGETTKSGRPEIVAEIRAMVEAVPPAAAAWALRAMAKRADSFDTLSKADVPALVVVGEEDALSPPSDAEAMVEAMPQGRFVQIAGAGHLACVETAPDFVAAVRGFMPSLS